MSNNVIVRPHSQQMFTIYDLQPSTGYTVRITAHNSAGSSVNTYSCTTLPLGEKQTCQQIFPKCPKKASLEPSPLLKAPTEAFTIKHLLKHYVCKNHEAQTAGGFKNLC